MEYWIFKGTSNFCSELEYELDTDQMSRCSPDGFYDIVSLQDTVEGGKHVIDYYEFEEIRKKLKIAIARLKEINVKESWSQRPGGSGSQAFKISEKALKEIEGE